MPKYTDYAAQTGGNLDVADLALVVDTSDTSMAATGTNKKIRTDEFAFGMAPLLSGSDPWTNAGNIITTLTVTGNSTTGTGWTNLGTLSSTQTLTG